MKRLLLALLFCSSLNAAEDNENCSFLFSSLKACNYKNISVMLEVNNVAADEIKLKKLHVVNNGNEYILNISSGVYMLQGDKGNISFADINFDGYADIGITTSFGLANLYFDYWVYDVYNKAYKYIGNFSKFKLNAQNKSLSNSVKLSANQYKNNTYYWSKYRLLKKNGSDTHY